MSNVQAFIHGVYPRSNTLSQTTRDFDRKRVTPAEVEKQQKADFETLLAAQQKAGLDYLEDGKLSWQVIFRPVVEATTGIEVGPLTRWFDNNSFYRQPVITGKVKLDTKKLDGYFLKLPAKQWKVTLPSPFTLAKVTDDPGNTLFEKTLDAFTEIYVDLVGYLVKKGVTFIQFNEPYIPYFQLKKPEIVLLGKAIEEIAKGKGRAKVAVQGYFGDTAGLVTALAENSAIDALGVDFTTTSLTSIPKGLSQEIIAGVVEGRNSLLEEKTAIVKFVEKLLVHFGEKTIYLSNNSDLNLLPESVAKEKIGLLGEVREKFSI